MTATTAATTLNRLIAAATARKVVLGEDRLTGKQGASQKRPYFRLTYQLMDEPTAVPGRKRGLLSVYCFGDTPQQAWHEATKLTTALGLEHDRPLPSPGGGLADYALWSGWERLPDGGEGGLVACAIEFHYYG